jgi:hypothetical protein
VSNQVIDTTLLRGQINFLYNYAWKEQGIPQEVIGVLNLLESLNEGEGDDE